MARPRRCRPFVQRQKIWRQPGRENQWINKSFFRMSLDVQGYNRSCRRSGRKDQTRWIRGSLPHRPGALPDFARRLLSKPRASAVVLLGGNTAARRADRHLSFWSLKLLIAPSCLHRRALAPAAVGCPGKPGLCSSSSGARHRAGAHQVAHGLRQDGLGLWWAASTATR